jgi:PAS domain S-box-containing protein
VDGGVHSARQVIVYRMTRSFESPEIKTRASADVLQRTLDSIPSLVMCVDKDFRFEFANEAYCEKRGITSEKIIGMHVSDVVGPKNYAQIEPHLHEAIAGKWVQVELPVVYPSGEAIINISYYPVKNDAGEVDRIVCQLTDITEMRRQQDAMRLSEAQLRAIFENSVAGAGQADAATGKLIRVNRRYCEITGYSEEELKALTTSDLTHPDDRAAHRQAIEAAVAGPDHTWQLEKRYVRKDGTIAWVFVAGNIVQTDGQKLAIATVVDITERVEAVQALRESEERFRLLADSVPTLIWLNGPTGCEFVNRSYLSFLGRTTEEVLGMAWATAVHPDDMDSYLGSYARCADERSQFEAQVRLKRADGEYRWMKSIGLPRFSATGEFLGYVGSSTDISDLKEIEEALRSHEFELSELVEEREALLQSEQVIRAQLEKTVEELRSFTYSVSHDLRTPLRAISSFAGLLIDDYSDTLPPEGQRYLQLIEDSTVKMDELMTGLLKLARLGRQPLDRRETDVTALVNEAIRQVTMSNTSRTAQFMIKQLTVCHADPVLLRQVFSNLISNAVKHTLERPDAMVEIGCIESLDKHCYYVRDNGIGFDMKYSEKLFRPFERLNNKIAGTGLGLAIVRQIVERHEGEVWAESKPGNGATFYFSIPK